MKIKNGVFLLDATIEYRHIPNIDTNSRPYFTWKSVIHRLYYESQLAKRPEYRECILTKDWFYFDNFLNWYNSKEYGENLDKDLKNFGKQEYSADNCLLLSKVTNNFLVGLFTEKSRLMKGVQLYTNRYRKCWKAQINNGVKTVCIGWFYSELEAHIAWQQAKIERLNHVRDLETSSEVKFYLTELENRLKLCIENNLELTFNNKEIKNV